MTQRKWLLQTSLKGQCHEMDIFLGLNILIRILSVNALISKAFHYPIQLLILFAFLKLLTNFENGY